MVNKNVERERRLKYGYHRRIPFLSTAGADVRFHEFADAGVRIAQYVAALGPACWADIQPHLNAPCPGVRQLACEALQEVEDEEVWEDVVYELLRDPDPGVRIMAGNGLRYTSHWNEVEIFFLRDTHPQVRLAGEYIRGERIMMDEMAKRIQ